MLHRRDLLAAFGAPAVLGPAALAGPGPHAPRPALLPLPEGDPRAQAADEDLWRPVQRQFAIDRSMTYLNSGGCSPSPRGVQELLARLTTEANHGPAYVLWRLQEPRKETVRAGLARLFGCDAEEVALVRNASEGLETVQLGLDLRPGDELLCSEQDYPRMRAAFRQRAAREGVVLREVPLPVPTDDAQEIVQRYADAITDRTRLLLCSQMVNLTGAVLPVRELCALGRERDVPVLVDGAHGFAHQLEGRDALDCDYYATSLHKWLYGPIGTGMLVVRRERIPHVWPLMAADEPLREDVRKFEQVGTHPVPLALALAESIAFHDAVGPERKLARLRWLRDRWAGRLVHDERVHFAAPLGPDQGGAIATVRIDGVDTKDLGAWLWREHRIYAIAIRTEAVDGLRVSPNLFTTCEEVDRFGDLLEHVLRHGLPA